MPIRRTYACPECMHLFDVVLAMDQVDEPPPDCPKCAAWDLRTQTQQQFKAPGIINSSPRSRANAVVEDIMANDYHVADVQRDRHEGATPKVRYVPKDIDGNKIADNRPRTSGPPANWNAIPQGALSEAIAFGKQTRKQHGTGLDVLQSNLKSGAQADLIEVSKRRSAKIW